MKENYCLLAVVFYKYDFFDEKQKKQVKGEGYKHYLLDANGEVKTVNFPTKVVDIPDNAYMQLPTVTVHYKTSTFGGTTTLRADKMDVIRS